MNEQNLSGIFVIIPPLTEYIAVGVVLWAADGSAH